MPRQLRRRSPSQARSRHTRAAIIEAAIQVFETHGYAAGTTIRVAERAGVSVGSLYQYFADKDAVLSAVAEDHIAEGARVLAPLLVGLEQDPEPAPALRGFVEAMVAIHRERPRLHRLLFEEAPLPDSLRQRVAQLQDTAAQAIAAWLRRRETPPADALLTARLLTDAVDALAHRFVLYPPDEADAERFVAETVRLLAAGLCGSGATPAA